jgi:hypothetical protein
VTRATAIAIATFACACTFHHGAAPSGGGDDAPAASDGDTDATLDTDLDGIPDATDNCPTVANPDQRDYDGDHHGDACDHCPHLPSTLDPDMDGDGVGDDCDPRPSLPGDRQVLWTAFSSPADITGWTQVDTWTVANNLLVQADATKGQPVISPPTSYAHAYLETELVVDALSTTGGFVGIGACSGAKGTAQYYCCTIYTPATLEPQSAWQGGGGQTQTAWTGTFAAGSVVHLVVNTAAGTACTATQGMTVVTSNQPGLGPTDGPAALYMDSAAASFRYLFIVEIGA